MTNSQKGSGKVTFWRIVLGILWLLGLYATYNRFFHGLGAATNLTDDFPWGLWIGFDVIGGVGLAAGGFTLTGLVYIFGIKRFSPIVRPTVLTAFLGYIIVIVGLLYDIGKWYNIYSPMFNWNVHSPLFEVAMCVMLYTTVLALEFSLNIFEKFKLKKLVKLHHVATPILVTLGIMLSTQHQSSLGTLFVLMPEKVHPLWYSTYLPVIFWVSCVMVAFAMIIFESYLSSRGLGKGLEEDLLRDIGRILVFMLPVYFTVRWGDLLTRGALSSLAQPGTERTMFIIENLVYLASFFLLLSKRIRENRNYLFLSACLVILGFVLHRMNVTITSILRFADGYYFPSWQEVTVTLSLIAFGVVAYTLAVKYLPVFPEGEWSKVEKGEIKVEHREKLPVVKLSKPALTIIGVVLVLGFIWVATGVKKERKLYTAPPLEAGTIKQIILDARDALADQLPGEYTFKKNPKSPGPVVFTHDSHYDPEKPNCSACHIKLFKFLEPGVSPQGELTMDAMRKGKQCGACHNGEIAFSVKKEDENCSNCHEM